jgi:protein TonB
MMKHRAVVWLLWGFVIALVAAPDASQEQAQAPSATQDEQVYQPGKEGVSIPRVIKRVDPQYTEAAKAAKIGGFVTLKAVVEPDGHTDRISVIKSLDKKYGLDDEAVKAAKKWIFEPAKKDGKPVGVWIELEMEFHLH